jgi:hypothetical protein
MTIQRDPTRCWVRIDTQDKAGGNTYYRTLIGDAWNREPFSGGGTLADEFSLTMGFTTTGDRTYCRSGMRLTVEEGTALRDALNEWLPS